MRSCVGRVAPICCIWPTRPFAHEAQPSHHRRVSKKLSTKRIFSEGLAANILNPKMGLFVLALFPQFIDPNGSSMFIQTVLLASILNGIGFLVNGAVILLGTSIRRRLSVVSRFPKLPQYLLATVFAGLACRLALGTRN